MLDTKLFRQELLDLPEEDRIQLAYWLLSTVVDTADNVKIKSAPGNPLLAFAGQFEGGNGDTAERAEEILEAEVNAVNGLGRAS